MQLILSQIRLYEALKSTIEELIVTDLNFPEYIFRDVWTFIPIIVVTTSGKEGNIHERLKEFLVFKKQDHYFIAPLDSDLYLAQNRPIAEMSINDSNAKFEKLWSTEFQSNTYYIGDGHGYYLYFNENKDWLIFDIMELGITLIGVNNEIDRDYIEHCLKDLYPLDKQLLEEQLKFNYSDYNENIFKANYGDLF